jgi:chromosome segregation ATPase
MDAIRKKMQSLKGETDGLYETIKRFEDKTAASNAICDQADCDIRDFGKKVHGYEIDFDETNDKLQKVTLMLEEKEKSFKEVESDISALSRRIMLMEEEAKKSEVGLADTVTKLALSSKEADGILKKVKVFESKCMNNEVTLEELDKNLRQTAKLASDNEQKLDELSRKLGVQEEELKRSIDRAELAEKNLKGIEDELQSVGENMKSLETSAEKAVQREEKLLDKIYNIQAKFKVAEGRFEYGEMNITKLNQKIDDIEDDIYREKLKIKRTADELGETFDDMLANY